MSTDLSTGPHTLVENPGSGLGPRLSSSYPCPSLPPRCIPVPSDLHGHYCLRYGTGSSAAACCPRSTQRRRVEATGPAEERYVKVSVASAASGGGHPGVPAGCRAGSTGVSAARIALDETPLSRVLLDSMGRPPQVPGKPRTAHVAVRLTPEGLAALDRIRGEQTRSQFIRDAIRRATEDRRSK